MSHQERSKLKLLPILGMILIIVANVIGAIYGSFTLTTKILAIVGVLLFLSLFLRVESSNLRHYLNVTLYVLFVLGIMVVIYMIVSNHPASWDLTKTKYFSLSPQTVKYLKGLTNLSKSLPLPIRNGRSRSSFSATLGKAVTLPTKSIIPFVMR